MSALTTVERKRGSTTGKSETRSPFMGLLDTLMFDSPDRTIDAIRRGLPAESIDTLATILGIPRAKLLPAVRIAQSTAERRLRKGETLTAEESDRVVRAGKVIGRALEVFESEEAARDWINDPVSSLGGESPLSMLDTTEGYERVMDTLGRIETGVYG